ncbi:MAG: class I SAM-dependent methyltransferase [Thermoflexales bacterium]|nr:class I SAM-dependent methyltransferase [Thermoflexales bacterium]
MPNFLYRFDPLDRLNKHFTRMMWRAFKQFIPPCSSLLEIGCGPASLVSLSVKELNCLGVASDIDVVALGYARRLASAIDVGVAPVQADGFCLPFGADCFDVVLSSGVIEHFTWAQTEQMVAEHARVCKPGGRVLIAVPNLFNLPLTYHKLRTGKRYHAYPERSYTFWSLACLVQRHGLRPIAYSGFAPAISLEWFIHKRLRFNWLDRVAPNWLLALFGYEVLVIAEKAD